MRQYPEKDDADELKVLNAEQWQLDLLKLNPSYVWWGNYEDYMWTKEGSSGWDSAQEIDTFKDIWGLDELNECINFYFTVYRENHQCPTCEGSNQNPETKRLADDWYDFERTGRKWNYQLTQVEVDALIKANRLSDLTHTFVKEDGWIPTGKIPTPDEVNAWAQIGMGHDSINHWICVEARAKHLGVYGNCTECEGGYIYDEPTAKVALQLWMIHPRKGCSRGLYVKEITQTDIPNVLAWLKTAATRNVERFQAVIDACEA